jgi:hypothetical protein
VTAEDREEQLSDDYMGQILKRLRIGIALIYVPILNLVWKVGHRSQPKVSKRRDAEGGLTFYLDGGMYTFLYPLDARHPDPPQSPLGSGILMGVIC